MEANAAAAAIIISRIINNSLHNGDVMCLMGRRSSPALHRREVDEQDVEVACRLCAAVGIGITHADLVQ